jgi:subtilase family serine protease
MDGRIKPDVVAPGTWMLAGYSDRFQQQYDPSPNPQSGFYQYDGWGFPANQAYKYMGGTSMSAPLVAGAAAVVRDYYEKAHDLEASAALVKATLINSAVDLLDENNDGSFDNAYPIPNPHEGWGRIDVANATDGSHAFADESAALSTGSSANFSFLIGTAGSPFKVTLVWTDYPSTTTAGVNLVNDLDLTLVAPDGTTYRGNAFAGGWSIAGGVPDRTNNVENVYVLSAAAGSWSIIVEGYNVPNGPQPFALVMDSVLQAPGTRPVVRTFAMDATAAEGGMSGSILFTRSGDNSAPLTVNYTVAGTATPDSDYFAHSGSITIPEGMSEVTVSIAVIDDSDVEPDETVVVTLAPDTAYDLGSPASAVVTIISDDLPPDLAVTTLTPPGPAAPGSFVSVTDTTMNKGTSPSQGSETGFYLSTNGSLDAADVFLGSRQVSALAAGTSESRTTPLTLPTATVPGTYYMLAKADWAGQVPETIETNNVRSSAAFRVGPDLVVSLLSAPATGAAGETLVVADTTANQGADVAAPSVTAFYLSANGSLDASDPLIGTRPVPQLEPAGSHQAPTTVTIPPSTAAGTYYILAKADGNAAVAESLEDNNLRASAQVKVGADLSVTAVSVPAAAGAGDSVTVADTTKNQGGADAPASTTSFYLSVNSQIDGADVLLGFRAVPPLDTGVSNPGSVSLTIPVGTPAGSYYILAKADAGNAVTETSETNNVKATSVFRVGPDLTVHALTAPAQGAPGEAVSVTVTIKNIGGGPAASSVATFALSLNTVADAGDVPLGEWNVPALVAGAVESTTTSLQIPESTAAGNYYIVATVDPANALAEVYENNNARSSAVVRIGPDLTVTVLNGPAAARVGTVVEMSDATKNLGGGVAPDSTTSYYLSTNGTLDAGDVLLGSRAVGALGGGLSSTGPASLTIPSTAVPGQYYVIARADGPGSITETVETNNTRARALRIDP